MDITTDLSVQNFKNPGQAVIFLIRKAYSEGDLSVSNNPAPEIQSMLNKPVEIKKTEFKIEEQDKLFLQELISKVESGKIKLFTPSSLLNQLAYDQLSQQLKAKVDYDILIIIHKIRQIKKLWDSGEKNSYQIYNLVHSLRLAKESLETQQGDVFII
jgi:hypothetical protein